jgi:hypothetical protein
MTTPGPPPSIPPPTPTVLSTTYSPVPSASTTVPSTTIPAGVVPAVLVGSWSRTEDQAEFAYRFLPDGRFRSVEILSQARPEGIFEYRRQQEGRVQVAGSRLVLRVSSLTTSRSDPGDPAGDYTDRPQEPDDLTYTWHASDTTLSLQSADGVVLALDRQP